jgi:hypothetical protein
VASDIGALQYPSADIGALQSLYVPPASISISPTSGQQGASLTITVSGTSTNFVAGTTTVSISGTGITIGTVTVSSSTGLTVNISISSTATASARTLTVTTGAEAPTVTFTVTALSGFTARGNIDYDQIRAAARQGNGSLFQMAGSGGWAQGHLLVFDANGNLIDGGGAGAPVVGVPATHSSTGTPGQIAYDSAGNFYWCYAANSWARIGSGGYSNSF